MTGRGRTRLALAGGALALALGAWFLLPLAWQAAPGGAATGEGALALGARLYAEQCAACHGANLEGQPDWRARRPDGRLPAPPHDATGHTWHHPDAVLFRLTRDGLGAVVPGYQSDMPAYAGTLSDAEIRAVLAYIKSRWPPEIRDRQAEIDRRAGR